MDDKLAVIKEVGEVAGYVRLAKEAGVDYTTIYHWRKGRKSEGRTDKVEAVYQAALALRAAGVTKARRGRKSQPKNEIHRRALQFGVAEVARRANAAYSQVRTVLISGKGDARVAEKVLKAINELEAEKAPVTEAVAS